MMLPIPGISDVASIGDELDRCYSPDGLARAVVDRVATWWRELSPDIVIEPSVGAGGILRQAKKRWPNARTIGIDIDRAALGLALCDEAVVDDFPTWAAEWRPPGGASVQILGNPPFSDDNAIAHVRSAIDLLRHPAWTEPGRQALILPWSFFGGVERWDFLDQPKNMPVSAAPITPRPWPDKVRETALYQWTPWGLDAPDVLPFRAIPIVWR